MHYGIFPQIIENTASLHQASSATFFATFALFHPIPQAKQNVATSALAAM
jgi:hypothetical protein